jgi:hypothetical protein
MEDQNYFRVNHILEVLVLEKYTCVSASVKQRDQVNNYGVPSMVWLPASPYKTLII